jgi:hypothetical protein
MGLAIREVPIAYDPGNLEQGKKIRWADGLGAPASRARGSLASRGVLLLDHAGVGADSEEVSQAPLVQHAISRCTPTAFFAGIEADQGAYETSWIQAGRDKT